MSAQHEKERNAEGKGGHIVESKPGFLCSVGKSLFVKLRAVPTISLSFHCCLNMSLHDGRHPHFFCLLNIKQPVPSLITNGHTKAGILTLTVVTSSS